MARFSVVFATCAVVLVLCLVPNLSAAPACTITWDGDAGTTNWSTATNWEGDVLPDVDDHACIPASETVVHSAGTDSILSLQADPLATFTLSGGTLNLTDPDPVNASTITNFTQSGGTLGGVAELNLSGTTTWSGGTMDGGVTNVLAGGDLAQAINNVTLANGRRLNIAAGASLDLSSNTTIISAGTPGQINNAGTVRRASGAGTANIIPPLDNDGDVLVDTGVLLLSGGTGTGSSTGDYGAPGAGGELQFTNGTHTLANGARLLGHTTVNGSTLSIPAGAAVTASGPNTLLSGTIGGAGTLDIPSDTFTWSGGTMDGGITNVATGARLLQATNNVSLANGRTLNIAAGASLELSGNTTIISGAGADQINNSGTVRHTTSSGTAAIQPPLDNDGLVLAESGQLHLAGGTGTGSSTGDYGAAAAGGELVFTNNTHTLANGSRLLGHTTVNGATLSIPAGAVVPANAVNGLVSGTIGGAGTFNVATNTFTWSGGTMDAGVTEVAAGARLLQTTNNVSLAGGRRLNIAAGGTFELDDNTIVISGAAGNQINNAGTVRHTGTGSAQILVPLDNDGDVLVDGGQLSLAGGTGTGSSTGDYGAASAGGELILGNNTHTLANGSRLLGHTIVNGATVSIPVGAVVTATGDNVFMSGTIGGAGSLDIASGTFTWSGGTMDGGVTTVAAGATLLQSTNNVTLSNGRRLNVAVGGLFELESPTIIISAGSDNQINNSGTVRHVRDAGSAQILAPLVNDGDLEAVTGILYLDELTQNAGATMRVAIDSAADFGAFDLGGTPNLDGTLAIDTAGSYNPVAGDQFDVVTYAAHTGMFNNVTGTDLGGGLEYQVTEGSTEVTLTVANAAAPETTITDGPPALTNNPEASIEFESSEAGSTFECRRDGALFGPCTSPQGYDGLLDGSHTFEVRAIDPAGNPDPTPASHTWTVDTAAPETAVDAGPSGSTSNQAASFDFSSPDTTASFQCRLDGGGFGSCTSPQNYNSLPDGSHTFEVRAIDPAGNPDLTPASRTWTITTADTTPPSASITLAPPATTSDSGASFEFGASEPGTSFACRLDGGAFEPCTSPKSYSGLPEGVHTFDLRATDSAGNSMVVSRSWTIEGPKTIADLPPPVIGQVANVQELSGRVFVAVPLSAAQKGLKFVPLEEARQIPIGSFLDTRKGTVALQSAATGDKTQQGTFASGLFQVLQSRRRSAKGLTDLVLKGGRFGSCAAAKPRGKGAQTALSRKALRRLRGNAKGRFRTRGRYSAATVRGTKWDVIDRCDNTLTLVSRGRVAVRDFRRKKTVIVRAGKSYTARAKR